MTTSLWSLGSWLDEVLCEGFTVRALRLIKSVTRGFSSVTPAETEKYLTQIELRKAQHKLDLC